DRARRRLAGGGGDGAGGVLAAPAVAPAEAPASAEVATDEPRMEGVHGDAGAVEPAGEFAGEVDVRQLRLVVRIHPPVVTLALQVIEVETAPRPLVRVRRHDDHPRGRAGA